MARQIVEHGYPLTIWARRSETVAPFADTAAAVVTTPAEVGAASDIIGICVVSGADVEDVVLRSDGVLAGTAPGSIVVVHSTVHPETCRSLAGIAASRGVTLLDAPVSGGGMAAAEGRLLVMTGGPPDALARCQPVFETFGAPVIHLGGVGSGQVAKVLNNLVFTAQLAVAVDTYAFGDRLHVDRAALAEVLAHGSGGSSAAAILARMGFDVAGVRQAAPLLQKDLEIALDLGVAAGALPPRVLAELAATALALLTDDDRLPAPEP
jgi:3-hydroxyisobutyrate dehydrogenase-like beta-hydroxyacid dehydrogenase